MSLSGHPDYPGTVSFNFSTSGGMAYLTVSGGSAAPVPSGGMGTYDFGTEMLWAGFAYRISNGTDGLSM